MTHDSHDFDFSAYLPEGIVSGDDVLNFVGQETLDRLEQELSTLFHARSSTAPPNLSTNSTAALLTEDFLTSFLPEGIVSGEDVLNFVGQETLDRLEQEFSTLFPNPSPRATASSAALLSEDLLTSFLPEASISVSVFMAPKTLHLEQEFSTFFDLLPPCISDEALDVFMTLLAEESMSSPVSPSGQLPEFEVEPPSQPSSLPPSSHMPYALADVVDLVDVDVDDDILKLLKEAFAGAVFFS